MSEIPIQQFWTEKKLDVDKSTSSLNGMPGQPKITAKKIDEFIRAIEL